MKHVAIVLLSVTILLLTACGTSAANDPNSAQMANPWTDCETLSEAEELAGFTLTAPEHIDGYDAPIYRFMHEKMLEIIYYNGDDEIRIRKAPARSSVGNDISGDYTEYREHAAITTADSDVILDGNDGTISRALWTANDFSYSITASPAISLEAMQHIVESVK